MINTIMSPFCSKRRNHHFTSLILCYYLSTTTTTTNSFSIARTTGTRTTHNPPAFFVPIGRSSGTQLYDYIENDSEVAASSASDEMESEQIPHVAEKSAPQGRGGGRVTMVGSGPGDPDLLTVAAYRIITDPDVMIISDRLVSSEILALVKGELKIARKHPGCAELAQEEIYRWVEEGLIENKHVVRLKIGDPFVFGRGGEEVLKFRGLGVEPVVIPGVSAVFSAPLLGCIPVTHRGVANQVVMCTGYGKNGTSPDLIKYHPEQTIVFLMAVGRLRELSSSLIKKAGYPSDVPVAIIQQAGCPEQRTVVGNLENIANVAEENNVKAPSTIIVGECVRVLLGEGEGVVQEGKVNGMMGGVALDDGRVC